MIAKRKIHPVWLAMIPTLALFTGLGLLIPDLASVVQAATLGFAPAVHYGAGANPIWVAAGNFNGDGKPDIVVANEGGQVSVLLNNGDGTFAAKVDYSVGITPTAVAVGDLNGDAKDDFVVARGSACTVSVLLNNGNGTFAAQTDYGASNCTTQMVVVGDFNGDGKPDLAYSNARDGSTSDVTVRMNDGDGSFDGTVATYAAESYRAFIPFGLVTGDFNSDGSLDWAVSNLAYSPPYIHVRLNDGDGTFDTTVISSQSGYGLDYLAAGDFSRDGALDLVSASSDYFYVHPNTNGGAFDSSYGFVANGGPRVTVTQDFDFDGNPDVLLANRTGNSVSIRYNGGAADLWSSAYTYAAGTTPVSAATADFNGDGLPDIVTANYGSGNVSVLLNQNLVNPSLAKTFNPSTVAPNQPATLTFTIRNDNPVATPLTGMAFTDTLPANLRVAGTPAVSNTCGGTVSAVADSNVISFTNGALAGRATCTIGVNVSSAVPNLYTNTTGPISSNESGVGNPSNSANLHVCTSSLVVSTNADSGVGSLRQAIAGACGGATITFDSDYTITLASTLTIDKDLTIDGETRAITISGNDDVRVFQVEAGVTATLQNLTITQGRAGTYDTPHGGGIYNQGVLAVTHSTLSYNLGGIRNEVGATLVVSGSQLSENWISSWGGDATYATGGAILNHGTMTVIGSTFSENYTTGIAAIGAVSNSGTATITNSTFDSNTAIMSGGALGNFGTMTIGSSTFISNSGGISPYGGGAILNQVDADGSLTISGSTFSNNIAEATSHLGDLSPANGGAIWSQGALSVATSTFQGNTATFVSGGSDTYGGAVVVIGMDTGDVSLTNNTFLDNDALLGGAVAAFGTNVALTNNTFVSNTATTSGTLWLQGSGTLYNNILVQGATGGNCEISADSIVTATNNLVDDDTCGSGFTNSDAIDLGTLGEYGGPTATIPLLPGSAAIDAGDGAHCPATDQRGVTRPQGSACDIGAFELKQVAMAVLGNGLVIANGDATPAPADDTDFGSAAITGAAITHTFTISNGGIGTLSLTASPPVTITGPAADDFSVTAQPDAAVTAGGTTTFTVRFAPSMAGTRAITVTIANSDNDENPYAFALQGEGQCLPAVTVQNNADSGAGSLRQAIANVCDGGRVTFAGDTAITLSAPLVIGQSLTIDGEAHAVTVSGNDAVRVFQVYTDTHVTFNGLTITHGKTITPEIGSSPVGGGIKIEAGAVVTVTDSAILSSTATYYDADWEEYYGHGGGIFNLGTLTVISTTFSDNVASSRTGYPTGNGGAIHNRGTLVVTDSLFSGNAGRSGGAIYNRSGAMLTVQDSTVVSNSAPCGGAGISSSGTAMVSNSTIADNVAPGEWCESDAAGIGNYKGTMTVSGSTIAGNVSEGFNGGGLSSYGANPDQGSLTVTDCAIYNNTANGSGGGIYNWWDSELTVSDSGIYSNTAAYDGGGILSGGNVNTKLTLVNSTLAHNTAQDGGGLYNGGFDSFGSDVLTMTNTTVVSNTATGSGGGFYNRDSANVILNNVLIWDNGAPTGPEIYNNSANRPTISDSDIEGSGGSGAWDTGLGTDGGGNLDQNPLLGALANNGGNTLTYALLPGSAAIDAGNSCPATDQRGMTRAGVCDIGAFESQGFTLAIIGGNHQTARIDTAFAAPLALSVTANAAAEPVDGGHVSFTAPASGASATPVTSTATIASGAVTQTVTANGTIGTYTVTASTAGGSSAPAFSLTNALTPTVTTMAATAITNTSATLNGTVNPNGGSTTVTFEYGVDAAYGMTVTASQSPVTGTTAISVSYSLSGLLPNTLYHYRAVGVNSIGTTYGGDQSFTTQCADAIAITNANDSGAGSLRQAIADVCAGGAITFDPAVFASAQTITLESSLAITKDMTIDGSTAAVAPIIGHNNTVVSFNITDGNVTLQSLAISDGKAGISHTASEKTLNLSNSTVSGNAGYGIVSMGTVKVENSTFSNNHNTAYDGGALMSTGVMTVTNSVFLNNSSVNDGGAVSVRGTATIVNSTFTGNTAGQGGGAIVVYNTATIINSTLSGNSVILSAVNYNYGDQLFINGGTVHLYNTILANGPNGADCRKSSGAETVDGTNNLIQKELSGSYPCSADMTNPIIGEDPLLGARGSYGGSTETMPLLPGSLAIDAGDTGACPVTDQRGIARVGICDIGAFESRGFTIIGSGGGDQHAAIGAAFLQPLTLTTASAYTEPVVGGQVVFTGPVSGAGINPIVVTGTVAVDGVASAPITANQTAGVYAIFATARGVTNSGAYMLTNDPGPTTAVLTSSHPVASVFGESVTFTATVTVDSPSTGIPTGVVTFTTVSGDLGTGTLDADGVTTYTTASLSAGSHIVTATYGGSANFAAGSSNPVTQTVNPASTATAQASAPNPSIFGQSVTFTATVTDSVTGAMPTGVVTFTLNSAEVPVVLVEGVAIYITDTLVVGSHVITATYGGDASFVSSSDNLTQVVNRAATTTTLASSPNPSVFGQNVTFTATLSAVSPSAGTPTGVVTFTLNNAEVPVALVDGVATYITDTLVATSPVITATYGGDDSFTRSSNSRTQVVNRAAATTALASGPNPSVFGQSVTFTATLSAVAPGAGMPTGVVTFTVNGTEVAVTLVNGVASYITDSLPLASHVITATYGGDASFTGSSNSLSQVVNRVAPGMAVASAPNPSVFGQNVTLTATLSAVLPGAGTPTGVVTFTADGSAIMGCSALAVTNGMATCTTALLDTGAHSVTVEYGGDANFLAGAGTLDGGQQVDKAATAAVTTSAPNPSIFKEPATFTATVSAVAPGAGTPTGVVTFTAGATPLGVVALDATGVATVTNAILAAGDHAINAQYDGDGDFLPAAAAVYTHTIVKAGTGTALVLAPNPARIGEGVRYTATVTVQPSNVTVFTPSPSGPTGSVRFTDPTGAIDLTGTVASGVATAIGGTIPAGSYTVTASYLGDASYSGSASDSSVLVVQKYASATQLTIGASSVPVGGSVDLTATVTLSDPTILGGASITGTVDFLIDGASIGSADLVDGRALRNIPAAAAGIFTVTARYLGNEAYAGSDSDVALLTVEKYSTQIVLSAAPNPSKVGDTVVMTATVEKQVAALTAAPPAAPTGQVQFYSGATLLDTVNLSGGLAALERNDFPIGVLTLTAAYLGDANFTGSTSDLVQQVVQPLPVAVNDAAGVLQGESVQIDPLANDRDPVGGGLTLTAVGQAGHGAAVIDEGGKTVTYTPDPTFSGVDSFLYTMQDINGNRDDALVAVVVTARSETGDAPQIGVIDNETGSNLTFADGGAQVDVQLPSGSYSGTLGERDVFYLAYTAVVTPTGDTGQQPDGLHFGALVFDLSAFLNGAQLENYVFPKPVTVVITYNPALLFGLDEETLVLLSWDGSTWSDNGIVLVDRDMQAHTLTVTLAHLSEFALFAAPRSPTSLDPGDEPATAGSLYLPAVMNASTPRAAQGAAIDAALEPVATPMPGEKEMDAAGFESAAAASRLHLPLITR